jgi:peptidoglycan/LPS O-acetylase OafA/YrhL
MTAMLAARRPAGLRSLRWPRVAAVVACGVVLGGPAFAADPTPDPAEPYFRGAPPVASVGLDLRVAHDRRPAREIGSRQLREIVR